jgi:hypothetical protein
MDRLPESALRLDGQTAYTWTQEAAMGMRKKSRIAIFLIVSAIGCDGANEIVAPPAPTPAPPPPTPTPSMVVSGFVRGVSNHPAKATVIAKRGDVEAARTTSNESDGAFRIGPLEAGEYELRAFGAGLCYSRPTTVSVPAGYAVILKFVGCF